ncbi:MAG TPA: DUF3168 domain-containing protein [Kaistia sp.]|nr:DUF3168 domain-containing protein [Kaistia sp.]
MEEALTAYLLASTPVTDLVGLRVTWDERPQGDALPAVVLNLIDSAPEYSDEGLAGLSMARVQIDCWAAHASGSNGSTLAKAVAKAVTGSMPVAMTVDGVEFQGVFLDAARDFPPETGPGGVQFFRRSLDYLLSFTSKEP